MQNRTDFETPRFSTTPSNMKVSSFLSMKSQKKVPKYTKYEINSMTCNFLKFLVCFQYFQIFFYHKIILTSENEVINCHNQNMAFLLSG